MPAGPGAPAGASPPRRRRREMLVLCRSDHRLHLGLAGGHRPVESLAGLVVLDLPLHAEQGLEFFDTEPRVHRRPLYERDQGSAVGYWCNGVHGMCLQVSPSDLSDQDVRYVVSAAQAHTALCAVSDCTHIFNRELGHAVGLSLKAKAAPSAFARHVLHVLLLRAEKQVVRVDA
jgi:hypothetical protein